MTGAALCARHGQGVIPGLLCPFKSHPVCRLKKTKKNFKAGVAEFQKILILWNFKKKKKTQEVDGLTKILSGSLILAGSLVLIAGGWGAYKAHTILSQFKKYNEENEKKFKSASAKRKNLIV